jgi:AraC family transcriptional regulator
VTGAESEARAAWPVPRFEEKPALALAGFGARYTCETLPSIPAQWMRFGSEVGRVSDDPSAFGLCYEWREGAMEYVCAAAAPPAAKLPEGWRRLALPAARYAIFSHAGHVSDMTRVASWILHEWLPASGRRAARGSSGGVELIEWYGPRFDPQTGFGDIEFWLPLEE